MLNKKIILSIFLVSFFVMASVNAVDDFNNDTVSADNNLSDASLVESINDEVLSANTKSFSDLNSLINDGSSWNIHLESDYTYNPVTDSQFVNGIPISRSINIYGDGFTINANSQARIFDVSNYVNFNNINFINAYSTNGAAILGSNYAVSNCNFTNNHATSNGGAMQGGYASNCIFDSNTADNRGGAMYQGSADNCIFRDNEANEGGAIYEVYATKSTFEDNNAKKQGGAMLGSSAGQCTFIGNSASDYSGAAFNAYVVDCTFINNSATHAGAIGGGSNSALNCIFDGNYAIDDGGAVYGYTVFDSTFTNNHAAQGGAMHTGSANNCLFENNYAYNVGGALMETYAVDCNFTNNNAKSGGAMYQNSAKNCIFTGNTAQNGGAMFNAHSDTCKFYSNTATLEGGAIYEGGADSSFFRYNSAHNGGAVALTDVLACTFYDNTAEEYGGAAYKTSARRSLFEGNTAKFGGAISGAPSGLAADTSSASECNFVKNVAKVTGGAKFNTYTADCEFEGNLPVYQLFVSDFEGIVGFGGDLHISMYDNPKYPVTGVNATIKIYNSKNQVIGTYKSEVGYNWFVNLAAGKYKAQVSVDDEAYEIDPIRVSITIMKSSFIYVANLTTSYQAGNVLLVNLHDSAGSPLKYAKVSVTLNGATKTYLTDDKGQVMIPTKTLTPKTYQVSVHFAGDANYLESSAEAHIIVKKVTPKLTAPKATLKVKDKTKKYVVTLKTNKNAVMKNIKITVKVNKKTYSVKTNSKGQAIFKLKKLTKKGKYTAEVTYAGNSIYNKVTKKVTITVK